MQVRIFEAGPFLSLCPHENPSFHCGICVSFNGSGTLHTLGAYQLLCSPVSRTTAWIAGNIQWGSFDQNECVLLAGVAQWIECQPVNQRVASWIPSQGTRLGCEPGPQ